MYGKHFQSAYTGSMIGAGTDVFAVWGYVIAHAVNGYVEINPALLKPIFGVSDKRVVAAIEYLCNADPNSRTPDEDGRRLVREGQFLYRVVNHIQYRNLASREEKQASDRNRMAAKRAAEKPLRISDVADSLGESPRVESVANVAYPDTDTDTESNTKEKTYKVNCVDRWPEFWRAYPRKVKKKSALAIWRRRKLDAIADVLLEDIKTRIAEDAQWKGGYIPHPTTYLNQDRWEDEITAPQQRKRA